MRLLHMIDSFSPAAGGPPEAVRQLIQATRAAGTDVEAVCLDPPGAEFLSGIACPVHALGESFLGRFAFSPRLWRWLRENAGRYDAIVMNGIWSFPGLALYIAARRMGKPYGIFPHGALDPWFNRRYPLKYIKKLLYWPVQYAVLRHAHAVFFTTKTERDLAKTSFRPSNWNSVVVPYGITEPEKPKGGPGGQIEAFYGKFPELRGRGYLLFLGRIHDKKGCDLLVEAFAEVAGSALGVDLVIAGPDQAGLQAKLMTMAERLGIANRVHWPGWIERRRKMGRVAGLRCLHSAIAPGKPRSVGGGSAGGRAPGSHQQSGKHLAGDQGRRGGPGGSRHAGRHGAAAAAVVRSAACGARGDGCPRPELFCRAIFDAANGGSDQRRVLFSKGRATKA